MGVASCSKVVTGGYTNVMQLHFNLFTAQQQRFTPSHII